MFFSNFERTLFCGNKHDKDILNFHPLMCKSTDIDVGRGLNSNGTTWNVFWCPRFKPKICYLYVIFSYFRLFSSYFWVRKLPFLVHFTFKGFKILRNSPIQCALKKARNPPDGTILHLEFKIFSGVTPPNPLKWRTLRGAACLRHALEIGWNCPNPP